MILGEHFSRYLDSGWDGDHYGSAHIRPLGIIWPYLLLGGFPWSLALTWFAAKRVWQRLRHKISFLPSEWDVFLLCWLLPILLFFTFARNMIWTYALPLMPPLALALATLWQGKLTDTLRKRLIVTACITPVLMAITVFMLSNDGGKKSQKSMIQAMHDQQVTNPGEVLYLNKRPFSSRFYSHGKSRLVESAEEITHLINNDKTDFLATRKGMFNNLPEFLQARFFPYS